MSDARSMTPLDTASRALALSQSGEDCFDALEPEAQESLRENVRAVLAAIREPSQKMLNAGEYDDFGLPGEGVYFGGHQLAESWMRMIDTALTE